MRGLGKDEFPEMLVKAAEEAEERCLPILEEKAAQGQTEGAGDVLGPTSVNMPLELMEDWDFMVSKEAPRQTLPITHNLYQISDGLFNVGNAEPVGWVFNDETTQDALLW